MHSSLKYKFAYRLTVVHESKKAKQYSWKTKLSLDDLVQLQCYAYNYLKTRYCSPLLDLSSLGFASALYQETEHVSYLLCKISSKIINKNQYMKISTFFSAVCVIDSLMKAKKSQ